MFDDHQADQTHNTDNSNSASSAPVMGIGVNPSPTYIPPADAAAPTVVMPSQSVPSNPVPSGGQAAAPASATASNDLEEIKRNALAQLSPLVGKLEQTPEEKYKTIMMMIQASDDQSLINEAYENAQKITDEKVKAEALLNIVNEINYFAQKSQS